MRATPRVRAAPGHARPFAGAADQGLWNSAAARLPGDALAQQDPVARRDAEKLGDAPDRVFLQLSIAPSANAISHIISMILILPSSSRARFRTLVK